MRRSRILLGCVGLAACHGDKSPATRASPCETGDIEPLPLHFVVLVDDDRAPTATSLHDDPDDPDQAYTGEELLRREADILNTWFVTASGEPVCDEEGCICFAYDSHEFYADIADSTCDLLDYGRMTDEDVLQSRAGVLHKMDRAVERCDDARLVAPNAINVYIYDYCAWDNTTGAANCDELTSHGSSNTGEDGLYHPLVALDLARLQHQIASPEEHEMGHALGLGHVCDPAVTGAEDSSNIMQQHCTGQGTAEGDDCTAEGDGGARDLGFGWVEHEIQSCELDQVPPLLDRARAFQRQWAARR